MLGKILLAVDGSEPAQKAVDWAIDAYRALPAAQFHILYVFEPFVPVGDIGGYIPTDFRIESMLEIPEDTPSYLAFQQFPDKQRVTHETLVGNPANVICEEARKGKFDVIVVGSEGHGAVASVLLGSVSAKLLHNAPCSVLVVR
ncbi:universal stress protein [Effusibacillus dendaii]|uniref:Universal stress protein n=1 Tax=Effusibacillus dendaii TaxID=2743772 RepID=A0A7I8D4Y3_9BACL|nr:universal stress protein [Effusibacillus dendaii]BCJ85178.1 universal stress protein [Effusibacillus dendaii]